MSTPPFELFARQTADRPHFLGFHLAAFAARERLDDAALAARLGCAVPTLADVRLCRAPRPEAFRADVTAVAAKFGLNPLALAEAAKARPVVPARADHAPDGAGAVLAARDRDDAP